MGLSQHARVRYCLTKILEQDVLTQQKLPEGQRRISIEVYDKETENYLSDLIENENARRSAYDNTTRVKLKIDLERKNTELIDVIGHYNNICSNKDLKAVDPAVNKKIEKLIAQKKAEVVSLRNELNGTVVEEFIKMVVRKRAKVDFGYNNGNEHVIFTTDDLLDLLMPENGN